MLRSFLLAVVLATPAVAAERTVGVGSFDRVRIEGAFDVAVVTGRSPRAVLSGDPRTLELVEVRSDGATLTVRRRGDTAFRPTTPLTVMLAAPSLRSMTVIGAARVHVSGMKIERADLSVAGSGTIAVERLAVEQANASVVGTGGITLAGRAAHLRLSTNGTGTIDAAKVDADDLVVRLDGPGETRATARYTATVGSAGSGRVIVAGKPKCTVRAPAGSDVVCGAP